MECINITKSETKIFILLRCPGIDDVFGDNSSLALYLDYPQRKLYINRQLTSLLTLFLSLRESILVKGGNYIKEYAQN